MVYLIWSISCGIVPVSHRTIGPIFSIIGGRCSVNRRGLLDGRGLLCEKALLGGGGGGGGGGGVSANLKNIKTHKYFFTYLNMVDFL
jgi:hypothetical protein